MYDKTFYYLSYKAMSRTLLIKDNISIDGNITYTKGFAEEEVYQSPFLHLNFTILVNGKLKKWGTHYELEKHGDGVVNNPFVYKLAQYHSWNDIKDLLCTMGYDLKEENIDNYIEQFQI